MVKKYVFGNPFETDAVTAKIEISEQTGGIGCGSISTENGFCFRYQSA